MIKDHNSPNRDFLCKVCPSVLDTESHHKYPFINV